MRDGMESLASSSAQNIQDMSEGQFTGSRNTGRGAMWSDFNICLIARTQLAQTYPIY
jgi:hypothetical protein